MPTPVLKLGMRVEVPWGPHRSRRGVVVDVWGDPPTHVRVELEPLTDDDPPSILLLSPDSVTPAA